MMARNKSEEVEVIEDEVFEVENIDLAEDVGFYSYEGSLTNTFIQSLVGSDNFKKFVKSYVNENIWVMEENDNLEEYDYLFTKHLIKSFVEYSKSVLSDVVGTSKKKEVIELRDEIEIEEGHTIIWHDIYQVIVKNNKNKRFAKFIKENK